MLVNALVRNGLTDPVVLYSMTTVPIKAMRELYDVTEKC